MSVFRQARQRRGTPADLLVVGLHNPGERYCGTRHNLGAQAVRAFAEHGGASFEADKRSRSEVARLSLAGLSVIAARPMTLMNESGIAVRALIKRHGIPDPDALVIVHDELDLSPGRIKLKLGGGTAGHNGLRSIGSHIKSLDFLRLRIGIGKPTDATPGAAWVLNRPSPTERAALDQACARAAAALELLAAEGAQAAMNFANAA